MEFLTSFLPVFKKFKIEFIILSVALIIALISGAIFLHSPSQDDKELSFEKKPQVRKTVTSKIFVEAAGAVQKPGVYEFSEGARIKDLLDSCGGLAESADRGFFSRNFNLARLLTDQEKIYVPTVSEISAGIFLENKQVLDYVEPQTSSNTNEGLASESTGTDINSATIDELDTLPGIGKTTAQKIIDNRPYNSVEELLSKKILKKNVYENLKNQLAVE